MKKTHWTLSSLAIYRLIHIHTQPCTATVLCPNFAIVYVRGWPEKSDLLIHKVSRILRFDVCFSND